MANFQLYKFAFEKHGNRTLFAETEGKNVDESLLNQWIIDAFARAMGMSEFQLPLIVERSSGKGNEFYPNTVRQHVAGVTLIELHNNKSKGIMPSNSTEEQRVSHHPYAYIIFDNRPASQAILVEQKSDAFADTNSVVRIFENWVNRKLNIKDLGWEFKARLRQSTDNVWDVVRARTATGADSLKTLSFRFTGRRPNARHEVDRLLQTMAEQLAAVDGEIRFKASPETQRLFQEENETLSLTIKTLIENHYNLKVGFTRSGTYEYGSETKAMHGIEDGHIVNFINAQTSIGSNGASTYALIEWLDSIMPDTRGHVYTPIRKRGRRS